MTPLHVFRPEAQSGTYSAEFIGDNTLVSGHHKTLRVWEAATGKLMQSIQAHAGIIWHLLRHNDTLYSAGNDNTVNAYHVQTWDKLHTLSVPDHACRMFIHDDVLYVGVFRVGVHAFDTGTGRALGLAAEHKDEIQGLFQLNCLCV